MIAWAIETTIVVAALAGAVFLVCRVFRPRPAVCHLLWTLALVKLLTPSFTTDWWPPQAIRDVVTGHAQSVAQMVPSGRNAPATTPRNAPEVIAKKLAYMPPSIEEKWEAQREMAERINSGEFEKDAAYPDEDRSAEEPSREEREEESREDSFAYAAIPDQGPPGVAGDSFMSVLPLGLVAIWIAGALAALIVQFRRMVRLSHLARQAAAPPTWLAQRVSAIARDFGIAPPRVFITDHLSGPVVWSLLRPRMLWPSELSENTNRGAIDGVIAHELAHLKRRDHWIAWLELIALCVWWWNPLQYLVRGQLRQHAELAADAWAVSLQPQRRRDYAEALIEVSSKQIHAGYAAPALGVASSGRRAFERRLSMIMTKRLSCRVSPLVIAGTLALGVGVLPSWSLAKSIATAVSEGDSLDPGIQRAIEIHELNRDLHAAVSSENWQSVAEVAATLASIDKTDGNARHWLGYSLIALGETARAREAFMQQARLGHDPEKAAYNIACTYALTGEGDSAMKYLDKAIAGGFHNLELLESDTDLDSLRERDDFGKLAAYIEKSGEIREMAEAAFEDELWADAAELYGRLCERHPYVQPLFHRYGYTSIAAGHLETALEAFQRETELDPDNSTAMYNIACSYSRMEKVEPALRSLAESIEHGFSNLDLLENDTDLDNLRDSRGFEEIVASLKNRIETQKIASAAFEEGDWSGAAEAWAAVIEMRPKHGPAYHDLGFSLHQLGKYDDAIAEFKKEAELGGALPRSLYNIACGYSMKDNADASLAHLEAAVECGFDNTELMLTDSDLTNIRGTERYIACVRHAGDAGVLANFGVRDWDEGYEKFAAEVKENPEDGRVWHRLGFAALRVGKHEEAMKAFKNQKEHGFAVPNAIYNMACVYAADGKKGDALKALKTSFEEGFNQVNYARIDPDLAPLWNDAGFRELIEAYADQNEETSHEEKESKEKDKGKD